MDYWDVKHPHRGYPSFVLFCFILFLLCIFHNNFHFSFFSFFFLRKSFRKRRDNDIKFKLRCSIASRIRETIKSKRTLEIIGCSLIELKEHLESQFKEGMSWDNYGVKGWHIDHIKPCALFDLSKS